jgi:NADH:ubiquinone reductase (non-electrogenic)
MRGGAQPATAQPATAHPATAAAAAQGKFFEAKCTEILTEEKAVVACFPEDAGFPEACFKVPYDILVLAVG